jgi:MFS family permease
VAPTLNPRAGAALLALLVASIFLNYIDRGSLSVAAPLLQHELALGPEQMGLLLGAFFWTYALLQLFGLAGWLADRYPVGLVLSAGLVLWSASTIGTGLVSGFTALFVMRLLLGAGESVAYPCYSRLLAQHVPQESRGLANSLLDAGSKLGPALGALAGGYLMEAAGWRGLFIWLGALSLLWLIPWSVWGPSSRPAPASPSAQPTIPFRLILRHREAWGAFAGHFCGNYYWFFLLTWLPGYLVSARGYSTRDMAAIGGLAFAVVAASTVLAGWLSDRFIRAGASPTRVRKTVVVSGLLASTVILPVAVIQHQTASLALLLAACAGFGVYVSNHWAITQTLSGPRAAGRWTSVQNGVGNLSGIVAPWLTGAVVQRTGSFHLAFVASALVALIGACMWGIVVREVKEVSWQS